MGGFDPNAPFTSMQSAAAPPAAAAFDPKAAYSATTSAEDSSGDAAFDPTKSFTPATAAATSSTQPKPEPQGVLGKVWDWLNSPLLNPKEAAESLMIGVPGMGLASHYIEAKAEPLLQSHAPKASTALHGVQAGAEEFLSQQTSPTSLGIAAASFGGGFVESALVKAGMPAIKAAGLVQKVKLGADLGFLTKYGFDLGRNTLPNLELAWGDYRAATNDRDRTKALDKFSKMSSEAVLGAVASGLAIKGVARDLHEIGQSSPKGQAMLHRAYADAVYNYQEENQVGTAQARQDIEHYNKRVPKEDRRIAIARNIEAGGDPNVLEAQALEAEKNPLTKNTAQELRDAKKLSPEEADVRDELRNKLSADLAHLKALGLLPEDGGLDNYLPHRWDVEDLDPDTGKPITKSLLDGDRDMLKKRKFSTIAEGEAKGLKPTTKDAVSLISDYHERVSNLIAKHNLAEALASGRLETGAPMAAPGHLFPGFTRPMDAPADAAEIDNLKRAGKFDGLIQSGRLYEVPGAPERTLYGTPKENVEAGGGVFRGAKGGVVEVTLPKELTDGLPIDQRMKNFVSITLPEAKVTPEAVRDAIVRKVGEMGGDKAQAAEFLKATIPAKPAYMWKQSDYVPSGLPVWRPMRETETPASQPNAIVTYGNGPVPEQAIIRQGERGIPTDQNPTERIPHARVPVYAAPEVAPHLEPMLESTAPKSALLRAVLGTSKEVKSDLLSLSPFHWATITSRALEAGVNPFGSSANRKMLFVPKDIDYYNLTPAQSEAIHNGVVAGSTRPGFSKYLEGLGAERDSFINKIPLVGDFNRAIEEHLFGPHGWITSLKFDLYDKLTQQIQAHRPDLTREQAGRIAASQVNNKFGGLNYTVMGRGAQTQNTLRLLLLAPDFLESTGRSILDVAGEHGGGLTKSLVAFNAAHWLFVRGLNYLHSNDTHPEAGFSVLSKDGKREYSVRSTLGDYLHFITKPRDFLANRVNPLARATDEVFQGEDNLGHKISNAQAFFDALRQVTPIGFQGLYPNQQISQPSAGDKALQSLGVGSRKRFSPAATLAQELETKHTGEGAPLEGDDLARAQLRYKLEDALRQSITQRDNAARVKAMQQIHSASSGSKPQLTPQEASDLIAKAHKFPMPLQASVDRLPLADALQVWDKAGLTERRALRPIVQSKIETWMLASYKHTREQNDSMRSRIQAFRRSLAE